MPRTLAPDCDHVVLAETARRQGRWRPGLAVCPFGPIAQPAERDTGAPANLCKTDIGNARLLCQRSQWLAPHQIAKLLPRKFLSHRVSLLFGIFIVISTVIMPRGLVGSLCGWCQIVTSMVKSPPES